MDLEKTEEPQVQDIEIEDEFDISNETPMCPNCHADLVKDEWSLNDDSYYCEDCGTWHSIAEVKQFS